MLRSSRQLGFSALTVYGLMFAGFAGCKQSDTEKKDNSSAPTSGTVNTGNPKDKDPASTPTSTVSDKELTGGTLNVEVVSAGALAINPSALRLAAEAGQSTTSTLESLQYRISTIQICRELQTNGTGFNNPTDCLTIYQGNNADNYDTFGYEQAKADTENYIDLMDPTSLAKLGSQLNLRMSDAHEYNYGLVNWYQPIKVKASVTLTDGTNPTTTIYTKDGPMVTEIIGVDNYHKFVTRIANVTTAPAEIAIIRHNNGGSWFKFAKPFVVTEQDIKDKTDFKLDLTFNPDGIVSAAKNAGSGQIAGVPATTFPSIGLDHPIYPDPFYSFEVPMLALTPIAHAVKQNVRKDTYLIHFRESADHYDMRVEIYAMDGDPAKSVMGVHFQGLMIPGSSDSPPHWYDPFFVEQKADGEIAMLGYEKKPLFSGFKRLPAIGDSGTMQFTSSYSTGCLQTDGQNCWNVQGYTHTYNLIYEFAHSDLLP